MIYYASTEVGYGLPLPTPELEARLQAIHPQDLFRDWNPWFYAGNATALLPTPTLPKVPPLRLGVLSWPTGATRPAFFHTVTTTARLNLLRAAMGNPASSQTLTLYDRRPGKILQADMFMLPPRPLNQLGKDLTDCWLLTLTDKRFFWPWKSGTIPTQPISWSDLINQLAAILGVTIVQDTIAAAYGTPSAKWISYFQPPATVLDAVLNQIGQKLVFGFGDIKTVNWTTAQAASEAYMNAYQIPGTNFYTGLIDGGLLQQADIQTYVPNAVNVLFADWSTMPVDPNPYVISVALSGLAIPGYGTATGLPNYAVSTYADLAYNGSNVSACTAYAIQAATDWYGWRLCDSDFVFPGIEPFEPTGWEDVVEWTYQQRDGGPFASTMVRRGEFNWFTNGGLDECPPGANCGSGSGSGSGSGCNGQLLQILTDSCPIFGGSGSGSSPVVTGIRNQYVTICLPSWYQVSAPFCEVDSTQCCASPPPPGIVCEPLCGSTPIPQQLYVGFSNFTTEGIGGVCFSSLNGTYVFPMNWTPSSPIFPFGGWQGGSIFDGNVGWSDCGTPTWIIYGNTFEFLMNCGAGAGLVVYVGWSGGTATWTQTSATITSCDPFCMIITGTLTVTVDFGGGTFSSTGTITVTANPSGICGTPPSTWNCDPTFGNCIEVYDGTGLYSTLALCRAACSAGSTSWNCVSDVCVQVGGTGGTYATEALCLASGCGGPPPITATLTGPCPPLNGAYVLTFLSDVGGVSYYSGAGPCGTTIVAAIPDSHTGNVTVTIASTQSCSFPSTWNASAPPSSWPSSLAWSATAEFHGTCVAGYFTCVAGGGTGCTATPPIMVTLS